MPAITTSEELRRANRGRILNCLRSHATLSRTHLCQLTQLSASTVSHATAELLDERVLLESKSSGAGDDPLDTARRGRPRLNLSLNGGVATVLVVSVLLNSIDTTLYDYAGKQLSQRRRRLQTQKMSAARLATQLYKSIDHILDQQRSYRRSLRHIAVAFQGRVATADGMLLSSPIIAADNVPVRQLLVERYAAEVSLHNDCNMIAHGFYRGTEPLMRSANAASDVLTASADAGAMIPDTDDPLTPDSFAIVLVSYGIGMGMYHRGRLLTGSRSSGAELGHMLHQADGARCRCGRAGCIEAYAAEYAIMRSAIGAAGGQNPELDFDAVEFERIAATAQRQDGVERRAFELAGAAIGRGLSNLFTFFDPFPVVLVGRHAVSMQLIHAAVQQELFRLAGEDVVALVGLHADRSDIDLVRAGTAALALAHVDHVLSGLGDSYAVTA